MFELIGLLFGVMFAVVKLSFGLLGLALGALYFLPAAIALFGHKRNAGWIVAANLLLGWTVVAWLVVLVWALASESRPRTLYAA